MCTIGRIEQLVPEAADGEWYVRIAPISFPQDAHGESVLVHQDSAYDSSALYESVSSWFAGGKPSASGAQYSKAFFVPADDQRKPFLIKDGFLRIRATHDAEGNEVVAPASPIARVRRSIIDGLTGTGAKCPAFPKASSKIWVR